MLCKISPRSFILGGQLYHMCCCAHILNLTVNDGLSIISSAIERVRDSVSFWIATPKREENFEETYPSNIVTERNLYKTLSSEDDWEMANEICQKLKLFYNLQSTDLVIHQMVEVMYAKFEKYWGDIGALMVVGGVLDPKYKLCFLEIFIP
ncbi:hypothetical protein Lal_00034009 [Lupinus albus]|nr:hypothetical protein Lal_00034009 [Lupinus albus]